MICDNIYRRIESKEFCVNIPDDGNIWPINKTEFSNGVYMPNEVIVGTFRQKELTDEITKKKIITIKDAKKSIGKKRI